MRGWLTSAPSGNASCNGVVYSPGRTGRIIELQVQATAGYTVQQWTAYAELNADYASMMYQPICFNNSDVIPYSFAHRPMGNRTDVTEFRIGIPSGLPAGSREADSYSRQIAQASSPQGGGIVTSTSQPATPVQPARPTLFRQPNGACTPGYTRCLRRAGQAFSMSDLLPYLVRVRRPATYWMLSPWGYVHWSTSGPRATPLPANNRPRQRCASASTAASHQVPKSPLRPLQVMQSPIPTTVLVLSLLGLLEV